MGASETFGGYFNVDLFEEGNELKGSLAFRPKQIGHEPAVRVPLVLSRVTSPGKEQNATARAQSNDASARDPGEITGVYDGADRAVQSNPQNAAAYYQRGLARQREAAPNKTSPDYSAAIEDYTRCLRLDSNNAEAHVKLGDCYGPTGRYDLAKREYDRAIEVSPKAKEFLDDSIAKEKARYCYAAIHDLDELTKMEPNNAALY